MPDGNAFHGEGSSDPPISSHTNAEKEAQDGETGVVGSEAAKRGDGREVQNDGDERFPAPVTVCQGAKDQSAQGTRRQRSGNRRDNERLGDLKMLGQRINQKNYGKKIESVQDPAGDTGCDCKLPARIYVWI